MVRQRLNRFVHVCLVVALIAPVMGAGASPSQATGPAQEPPPIAEPSPAPQGLAPADPTVMTTDQASRWQPIVEQTLKQTASKFDTPITILSTRLSPGELVIDVSASILANGLDIGLEENLHWLLAEVTNIDAPELKNMTYTVLVEGVPLHEILQAEDAKLTIEMGTAQVETGPLPQAATSGPLVGRKIALSAGHGLFFDPGTNTWRTGRGNVNGVIEDYVNAQMVIRLANLLAAQGATVYPARTLDHSLGNGASGQAHWREGASAHLQAVGVPSSVWNSVGPGESSDLRARPLYANHVGADILINLHNNGGGGNGTETWYDTNNGHQAGSLHLANNVQNALVNRLRSSYDSRWASRGVKGSNGGYGENRIATRPAIIVEVAFMDFYGSSTTPNNNQALQDPRFWDVAAQGVFEGILNYYGVSAQATGPANCPAISAWQGEYWSNTALTDNRVVCRNDTDINFNWVLRSPANGLPAEGFSARWTRTVWLEAGTYRFRLGGDDGVRLWVNNTEVVKGWKVQGFTEYSADVTLGTGNHTLRVEYFDATEHAAVRLTWERLSSGGTTCPTITGWKGEYWNNQTLTGSPVLCRDDSQITFDWNAGSPASNVPVNNFSARWTRTLWFQGGTHTFRLAGDDGVRLWLNDALLIDAWRDQGLTEYVVHVPLVAGNYTVRVEYYENAEMAAVLFNWHLTGGTNVFVLPRDYNFTWGSSGQGIWVNNTVYCSANPDTTKVIYWRTNDTNTSAGVNDFNPTVTTAGYYDIYVFIPSYTHSAPVTEQAKYYFNSGQPGSSTELLATVNQNFNKCEWMFIGRRWFEAGTAATISMPARTNENPYRLIAGDGLRLLSVSATDNTPPSGAITSPANNTTIGPSTVNVAANANDNPGGSGVAAVHFSVMVDGQWRDIGSDTTMPYNIGWPTPAGLKSQQLRFAMRVVDHAGNITYNAGGHVVVNYVESQGNPGVTERWLPSNQRAYLNQLSLADGWKKCASASAAMVLAMMGKIGKDYNSLRDTANAIHPNTLKGNTTYLYLVANEITKRGVRAEYHHRNTNDAWAMVKTEINANRPVIISGGKFTKAGHFVVVVGYREGANLREIIVYDPFGKWLGTQGSYDKNGTGSSSNKGQWVIYSFAAAFGDGPGANLGWITTLRPTSLAALPDGNEAMLALDEPDPISTEPEEIVDYEGIVVFSNTMYVPLIVR